MTYYIKLSSVYYAMWEIDWNDVKILVDTGVEEMHLNSYFKGKVLKLQVV